MQRNILKAHSPPRVRLLTSSRISPPATSSALFNAPSTCINSRPTIIRINSSCVISFVIFVPTYFPSRKTVTRSLRRKISSIRWLTYKMLTPSAFNCRITRNSTCVSRVDSDAVGSSMIKSRHLCDSARAIPTICRCAMGNSPTAFHGSIFSPSRSKSAVVSRSIFGRSRKSL